VGHLRGTQASTTAVCSLLEVLVDDVNFVTCNVKLPGNFTLKEIRISELE
jgi:hypothetical protein